MMDLTPYYNFATKIALKAGKILLDHYSADFRIAYKGLGKTNLVTEIDLLCEETIVKAIKKQYPSHDILGEEGVSEKPVRKSKKASAKAHAVKNVKTSKKAKKSDFRWIIDPLDGTVNYAHGYPFYCVSIALEYKGDVVVGVVYAPHFDELFSAVKGNGAFLNNIPIAVSTVKKLDEALLATGFAYTHRTKNLPFFERFLVKSQAVRRGGAAALELACVAAGRLDAFWEFNLEPWDIAAGALILKEAGGISTMMDGDKLDLHGKNIVASNGLLHKQMIKNIQEVSVRGKLQKTKDKKKVPMWR